MKELTDPKWVCECKHTFEQHDFPDIRYMPLHAVLERYGAGECRYNYDECRCEKFKTINNLDYVEWIEALKKSE